MSHGTYAALKIVPCPCGSTEPYWHGPEDGPRIYCCDTCWDAIEEAAAHGRSLGVNRKENDQ